MRVRFGVSALTLLFLLPAALFAQGQIDLMTPAEVGAATLKPGALALRVRLLKADAPPPVIDVAFRRGLYWKQAGTLGKVKLGEWTLPKDCNDFFSGQGASDFVVIEFAKCVNFEAEYELSVGGKALKTIRETGRRTFSVIVIPAWLLRRGAKPTDPEFLAGFLSLTDFNRARLKRFDEAFKDNPRLPQKYAFEANFGGYVDDDTVNERVNIWGRHSSLEALKAEVRILRHLGYNGFCGEGSLALAAKAGLRDDFTHHITFSHAQAPWYQIACPFDPKLEAKRGDMIESLKKRAEALQGVKDIWVHWGDEIGCIAKADHIKPCPECGKRFREYLQSLNLKPELFGRRAWDEVVPFADWEGPKPGAEKSKNPADKGRPTAGSWPCNTPEEAANLYYSMRFVNWSTARFYEPAARTLKDAGIRISPLRGPTPTWDGHSLDYFEFYESTPSTALTWETSNRDARVWVWDAYLADITRTIGLTNGVPVHVYIKPHRGAPAQRLMACVARGVRSFCWYNYGPPYGQGDEYTGASREPLMMDVARAVRLLAQAEDITYDGRRLPEKAPVAFLYPITSFNLRRGIGHTEHFQDAKWVWTALRHEQAPVDVLSEALIEKGALEGRRALFVVGSHLRSNTARAVLDWVKKGGILWTDAEGLGRNECDQAAPELVELTGQKAPAVTLWGRDPGYHATGLQPFFGMEKGKPYEAPAAAAIRAEPGFGLAGALKAAIGRQTLEAAGAEVLARFADGAPALIRRKVGAGRVYVAATFAGLAYSETVRRPDYDMAADFDPIQRRLITCALPEDLARAAVASVPTVEAEVILRNGEAALLLANWTHKTEMTPPVNEKAQPTYRPRLMPVEKLRVELPALAAAAQARSAAGNKVAVAREGARVVVTLDRLDAADIILLSGARAALDDSSPHLARRDPQ